MAISSFSLTFRRIVVPKLEGMVESRGLFVALGIDEFGEALSEIREEAIRLGAAYLPDEIYEELLEWTATTLIEAADAAWDRVHGG